MKKLSLNWRSNKDRAVELPRHIHGPSSAPKWRYRKSSAPR